MTDASIFDSAFEEIELIGRHIEMLKVTKEMQPIGIIRLSEALGIPKHKVRYSLRLLEKDGLIIATSEGAMVSDKYEDFIAGVPGQLEALIGQINKIKNSGSKPVRR
jgi:predicted transcriptional regulator